MRACISAFILVLLCSVSACSQFDNGGNTAGGVKYYVSWETAVSKADPQPGDIITLRFMADIEADWYLYSSDFSKDLGPTVTEINFEANDTYELVGTLHPMNPKKKYDDIWDGDYTYFKKKGEFRQRIKVLKKDFNVTANLRAQHCSDVTGACIMQKEAFKFSKDSKVKAVSDPLPLPKDKSEKAETKPADTDTKAGSGNSEGNSNEADSNDESETDTDASLPEIEGEEASAGDEVGGFTVVETPKNDEAKETIDTSETDTESTPGSEKKESLLSFAVLAFLGGLTALLTPCVFPMIPMTVSFFTNRTKNRTQAITQGITYGLSIIAIYTLIGVLVSRIFGAEAGNIIATHWLSNLIFFAVFIIFALSFFGAFEITLPSSFTNAIDKKADQGGLGGIFFMAFTLVLVSFSCTGPVVGTVLIESAGGDVLRPIVGMFGFSMAFALPFALFAIFPSWLQALPKSGGWLNVVKVILGFVELALAFKFFSVADQVYHWGILDRHVYIAIWAAISFTAGLYLLGKIRLPHDSPVEKIGVTRLLLALASFTFVVYLLPGMFGAPLKALSGYLPPQSTHDFNLNQIIRENVEMNVPAAGVTAAAAEGGINYTDARYADKFHLPHGLKGFFEYRQAIEKAKAANKPIFIDFTGHGCVNCRKMEANVWAETPVLKRLKNNFIITALYVDDTQEAEEGYYYENAEGETLKTIGDINMAIQIEKFGNNAQPYYILLDPHTEELLVSSPVGFEEDVAAFTAYLDKGLKKFEELHGE